MDDETPGPTGKFPDGRISSDDEGELAIKLSLDTACKLVVLDFGKDVKWLALPPDAARQLGIRLVHDAGKLDGCWTTIQFSSGKAN